MKLISNVCLLILLCITMTACGGRTPTDVDKDIAGKQSAAAVACYTAQAAKVPDMTNWKPEQITVYELTKALKESNKIIAKVPLDECAKAGGTNMYDAEIAISHDSSETTGKWLTFGEGLATKLLYAYGIHEAFDYLKTAGSTNVDLNGDGNTVDGVGNKGNNWSLTKNPFTDNHTENNDLSTNITKSNLSSTTK